MSEPFKKEFTGRVEYESEDSGCALIAEVGGKTNDKMFVRLHSWDQNRNHTTARKFANKWVKVTVEVLEEE